MEINPRIPSFLNLADRFPFVALQNQIDQVFADFGKNLPFDTVEHFNGFGIAVDVIETDKSLEITAETPGVSEKDLHVTLVGNVLTIQGKKEDSREAGSKSYRMSERRLGSFSRSFVLPFIAEPKSIEARFDKGVLKITVAKRPEAAPAMQNIPVKVTG